MVTVYLDTSFFVWLARANDEDAQDTLQRLNDLGVRHVLSLGLVKELCSSQARPELNRRLYNRVQSFAILPLKIPEDIGWELLLAPPQFSSILREVDDLATVAHSQGLVAGKVLSKDQQDEWNQANQGVVRQLQDDQGRWDQQRALAFAKQLLEPLQALNPSLDLGSVLVMFDQPAVDPMALHDRLMEVIGSENVARLKQEQELQRSVTATDNRPLEVALGRETNAKALANTYRDAEHMHLFVQHADEIDYLQVDGPQEQQIKKRSPKHYLVTLGLHERCFSAKDLEEVCTKITSFVGTHPA
jgi:hypothetical protein